MNKIDEYLDLLPSWKRANLQLFRKLVHEVEPSISEDWKWNVQRKKDKTFNAESCNN